MMLALLKKVCFFIEKHEIVWVTPYFLNGSVGVVEVKVRFGCRSVLLQE